MLANGVTARLDILREHKKNDSDANPYLKYLRAVWRHGHGNKLFEFFNTTAVQRKRHDTAISMRSRMDLIAEAIERLPGGRVQAVRRYF